VADSVNVLLNLLDNGTIKPQDIRETHILELKEHRQRLFALLNELFERIGYHDMNGETCFSRVYYNKIMHHTNGLSWKRVQNELA
jgi:hypothetical protein